MKPTKYDFFCIWVDPIANRIAIRVWIANQFFFGSRSRTGLRSEFFLDRDQGLDRDPKKNWIAIPIRSRPTTLVRTVPYRNVSVPYRTVSEPYRTVSVPFSVFFYRTVLSAKRTEPLILTVRILVFDREPYRTKMGIVIRL